MPIPLHYLSPTAHRSGIPIPVPTNMSRLLSLSPGLSSVVRRGNNSGSILSGSRRRPLTQTLSTITKAQRPKREMNALHVATALAQVQVSGEYKINCCILLLLPLVWAGDLPLQL